MTVRPGALLIALLLLASGAGCGVINDFFGGSTEPDPVPPPDAEIPASDHGLLLAAEQGDLTAFRLVTAVRHDGAPLLLQKQEYHGMIEMTAVKLRAVEGRLVFIVPYGVVGSVLLRVALDDGPAVLPLTLLPPPHIADPAAVMAAFFDEQHNDIGEDKVWLTELVGRGTLPASVIDEATELQNSFEAFRQQFLALPLDEQRLVALAVTTFNAEIAPHVAAGEAVLAVLGTKSYQDMQQTRELVGKFLYQLALFAAPAVIGGLVWGLPGSILATYICRNYMRKQKQQVVIAWSELADTNLRAIDLVVTEYKADLAFSQGKAVPISVDVGWRRLQANDETGSPSWISSLIAGVKKTNAIWKQLFPGGIELEFSQPNRQADDPHELQALEMIELSSATVQCALGGTPAAPELTCWKGDAGVETFTFRLRYWIERWGDEATFVDSPVITALIDSRCMTSETDDGTVRRVSRTCSDAALMQTIHEGCQVVAGTCTEWGTGGTLGDGSWQSLKAYPDPGGVVVIEAQHTNAQERRYERCINSNGVTSSDSGGRFYNLTSSSCTVAAWGRAFNSTSGDRWSCNDAPTIRTPCSWHWGCSNSVKDASAVPDCSRVKALTPLSLGGMSIMQEGLCGPPSSCPAAGF